MQINCISSKNVEDTRTIYTKNETVEMFIIAVQTMSLIDLLIQL